MPLRMSPNEPDPQNQKPEEPSEDDWGEDWGDEGAAEVQETAPEPTQEPTPEPENRPTDAPAAPRKAQVKVREISGAPVQKSLPERPASGKVERKEVAFTPAPVGRQGIEEKEWGEATTFKLRWVLPITFGMIAMVIGCLAALHIMDPFGTRDDDNSDEQRAQQLEAARDAMLKDIAERKDEARKLYSDFASSRVVEEILPMIRNSGELEGLIRRIGHQPLADRQWEVPMKTSWKSHVFNGRLYAILKGEHENFTDFRAYFVVENDQLLLDWKATTAYSTASFADLSQGKGDASEVRGVMKPATLYTDVWPEGEYRCYQLISPDGDDVIWCYAKVGTDEAKILHRHFMRGEIVDRQDEALLLTLELKRGTDGGLPNQWLIEGLHHHEWIRF